MKIKDTSKDNPKKVSCCKFELIPRNKFINSFSNLHFWQEKKPEQNSALSVKKKKTKKKLSSQLFFHIYITAKHLKFLYSWYERVVGKLLRLTSK